MNPNENVYIMRKNPFQPNSRLKKFQRPKKERFRCLKSPKLLQVQSKKFSIQVSTQSHRIIKIKPEHRPHQPQSDFQWRQMFTVTKIDFYLLKFSSAREIVVFLLVAAAAFHECVCEHNSSMYVRIVCRNIKFIRLYNDQATPISNLIYRC